MSNKEEIKNLLDKNPKYKQDLFKRGFLITSNKNIDDKEYPFYGLWKKENLGQYEVYLHPKQDLYKYEYKEKIFFLIGHAYNPYTMEIDEIKILEKIANNSDAQDKSYFDAINEITGLFIFGYVKNEKLQIIIDCAGMQGGYYGIAKNDVYISSHMQLIGDICDLEMDQYVKDLVNYKFYKLYGPFLPGDLSSYKEVKRLVPNTYVNYSDGHFTVKRFFPNENIKVCSNKEEYDKTIKEIGEQLHRNMELISKKWSKPAISMTGGMDSKTTVACTNGLYDKFKYFSYISMDGEAIDANAAHTISKDIGIEHEIYDIPRNNDEFKDLDIVTTIINHNFGNIGKLNQNDMRKRLYFRDTEDFDVEVKSWVSEIGRANYYKKFGKKKMPTPLSNRNLTSMYKFFVTNRKLVKQTDKAFEEYRKKFDFDNGLYNYDPSDMFLWEIRYGGWGGLVITGEHRYSFDITIPYNNRNLMKLFLSLPLEDRIKDKPHEDVIKLMNKTIDDTGITIVNYNETKKRMYIEKMYFNLNNWFEFI